MQTIEQLAQEYGAQHEELRARLEALREEIRAARNRHIKGIRDQVSRVNQAQADLVEAVRAAPGEFVKPKTREAHGVRFGWMKPRGALKWPAKYTPKLIALIRKLLPEKAAVLIKEDPKPVKKALQQLPADTLQRLGIEVIGGPDAPVAFPTSDECDKLVAALIAEEEKSDGAD